MIFSNFFKIAYIIRIFELKTKTFYLFMTIKFQLVYSNIFSLFDYNSLFSIIDPLVINTVPFEDEQLLPNWIHCLRLHDRFNFVEKYSKYLPNEHEVPFFNKMIDYNDSENPLQFTQLLDLVTCREVTCSIV